MKLCCLWCNRQAKTIDTCACDMKCNIAIWVFCVDDLNSSFLFYFVCLLVGFLFSEDFALIFDKTSFGVKIHAERKIL